MQKTLTLKVLERALTASDLQALVEKYNSVKKAGISGSRLETLSSSITEEEKLLIEKYFSDVPYSELRAIYPESKSASTIYSKVARVAVKMLYQSRSK